MRFIMDGEMPEYLLAKDLILQVRGVVWGAVCVCGWGGGVNEVKAVQTG